MRNYQYNKTKSATSFSVGKINIVELIIFTGLPGTGKSSLADAVGRELGVPVFARDWLVATLRTAGFGLHQNSARILGFAGYELLTTLAWRQLSLGQSAILDCVLGMTSTRERWRKLTVEYSAGWRVIECICSNEEIHRARLQNRRRDKPGWANVTWETVERLSADYAPWEQDRLVIDSVLSVDDNVRTVLNHLRPG
ncbi:MAG: ATP-binding protein [Chloroflexi bacterium]|nr:MAG: ATP-binding protein [Chloroflexota bacterium]